VKQDTDKGADIINDMLLKKSALPTRIKKDFQTATVLREVMPYSPGCIYVITPPSSNMVVLPNQVHWRYTKYRRLHSCPLAPLGLILVYTLTSNPYWSIPLTTAVQHRLHFDGARDLPDEVKRWLVNPANPENPFHNLIGQEAVKSKLARLAFQALGREDHCARDLGIALLGPAGTGKTSFARAFAELLGLPFVCLNPQRLRRTHDVFEGIASALASFPSEPDEPELAFQPVRANYYTAPPCVVLIDEVHQLAKKVEQGLLTAAENMTHRLETETGVNLNCYHICWMVATTDRGLLFDAFDTRFSKAQFVPYNREEIAEIIEVNHRDMPPDICESIARFAGSVTREALAFATEVVHQVDMANCSWEEAVEAIRREQGIDEFGMTSQRLAILNALSSQGPISLARLQGVAQVKIEELLKFTLPPLLEANDERDSLIRVSSRGYLITEAGREELDRRSSCPTKTRD
jgi:Holliday junction resolvasome RuvABC ATP-dependent DNA helicase subunit